MKLSVILVFVGLISCSFPTWSQSDYEKYGVKGSLNETLQPLKVGEKAPDFQIENSRLTELLKEGPVVLFFYRGHWCGYCTRYIADLENNMTKLKEKGYHVVGIVPQKEKYVDEAINKTKASFPIIADTDLEIMKSYHVAFNTTQAYSEKVEKYTKLTLSEMNGAEVLPIPATYVIDQDRVIRWVHFDPDYSQRASIEDILRLDL